MRVAEVPRTGIGPRGERGVDGLLRMNLTDTGFALRTAGLCCEEEGLRSAL